MRILTVCLGNICRSPYAAAVLTHHGGGAAEVRSAGLSGKWIGQGGHPDMVKTAAMRGFDLSGHHAVQVTDELLEWAHVILAMDRSVEAQLHGRTAGFTARKIHLYLEEGDVPDPYGQDAAAFTACAEAIEAGAARHLPPKGE
ncbi:low molecular weight protein-tyrosine-phosphatase [Streptomyces sp. NPDC059009]|uniref:low molecular weight protein-tyrosine-phosphatase n=1 Tax=Streptomyces sp. NPDC059009 TaxID=3346694 RepID=UPI0036917DD8